ncbi:hypothetical protein [Malacoplasma muris]|uniref:hypothetical protein n=1 Tax=Malacoplasma muris TaxID=2119 RepID=UPI00398E4C6C
MKKIKLLKVIPFFATVGLIAPIPFIGVTNQINTLNIMSNNLSSNTSNSEIINTNKQHIGFVEKTTKHGILNYALDTTNQIVNSNSSISSYSHFGTLLWQYNFRDSNFFNQIGATQGSKVNTEVIETFSIRYNSSFDQVIVYGKTKGSTSGFLFALDAKTGAEVLVSQGDTKYIDSFLVQNRYNQNEKTRLPFTPDILDFDKDGNIVISARQTITNLLTSGIIKISPRTLTISTCKLNNDMFKINTSGTIDDSVLLNDKIAIQSLGHVKDNLHYILFVNSDSTNTTYANAIQEMTIFFVNLNFQNYYSYNATGNKKPIFYNFSRMSKYSNDNTSADKRRITFGKDWTTEGYPKNELDSITEKDNASIHYSIKMNENTLPEKMTINYQNLVSTGFVTHSDTNQFSTISFLHGSTVNNSLSMMSRISVDSSKFTNQLEISKTEVGNILSTDAKVNLTTRLFKEKNNSTENFWYLFNSFTFDTINNAAYATIAYNAENTGIKSSIIRIDLNTMEYNGLNTINITTGIKERYLDGGIISFSDTKGKTRLMLQSVENTTPTLIGMYSDNTNITNVSDFTIGNIDIPTLNNPQDLAQSKQLLAKLPQDLTDQEILSLIEYGNGYTKETTTKNKSTTSTTLVKSYRVSLEKKNDQNFFADNDKGTLKFTAVANFKKWWDPNSNEYYQINIPTQTITNFYTNNSLSIKQVIGPEIDSQKYREVQNLIETVYPSNVTKEQIYNNFFVFGSTTNTMITTSNIEIKKATYNPNETMNNNIYILAFADDNTGILTIKYKNPHTSNTLDAQYSSGVNSYIFNRKLNNYDEIKINEQKLASLSSSKTLYELTKTDILNALTISSGYSTNLDNWNITGVGSNSTLDDAWEGTPNITISYIRRPNVDPDESIKPTFNEITINSTNTKFIPLKSVFSNYKKIENTSSGLFSFNSQVANKLIQNRQAEEIINEISSGNLDIFKNSLIIKNDLIDYNNLEIRLISNQGDSLQYGIKIPEDAQTNITFGNTKLKLNNDIVNKINSNNDTTSPTNETFTLFVITLTITRTNFQWNHNLSSDSSSVKASSIKISNPYQNLPSKYMEKFTKDSSQGYIQFQNETQLLSIPNAVNDPYSNYVIKNVDLSSNDFNGVLLVSYDLYYPELQASRIATMSISGFLSTTIIIAFWSSLIILIGIIIASIWISIHVAKSKDKKYKVFSSNNFYKNFKKSKKIK